MRVIHACLDACIYNRLVTQGQPGSTVECFEELKELATGGKVRVVIPEVVVLEFERFCHDLTNRYTISMDRLKKAIAEVCDRKEKDIQWNEIGDVKQSLTAHVDAIAAEKKALFPERIKAVHDWLHSDAVEAVPFTSEIWLLGKRRLMSGRMPPTERKSDQDACLIESVLKGVPKDEELYFASENAKDFAVEIPNKGFAFHPLIAEDLPKAKFFIDLCTLVESLKTGKVTPAPTGEELMEAAQKATRRPRFLTVLKRIRPLVENYLQSLDPGVDNAIRNPQFRRLYHEFSKSRAWECLGRRAPTEVRSLCKSINDTLTEMVKHNQVIEYESVRMKHDTSNHQMAMERLASQFLDLHDELLDLWKR